MTRTLLAAATAGLLAASCTGAKPTGQGSTPPGAGGSAATASSPAGTPQPLPPPHSVPGPIHVSGGGYRFFAASGRVRLGVPYRFTLSTHCGLGSLVDFDGSFWDVAGDGGPNPPPGFGNPSDQGVMTLTSVDQAVYRSSQGVAATFVRHGRSKVSLLCA